LFVFYNFVARVGCSIGTCPDVSLSATAAPNGTVGAERNTPTFGGCQARPEAAALAPAPGGNVCHLLGCQARPKATLAPKTGVHQKAFRRARSLYRRPLRHGVRRIPPQGLPARTEAAQAPKRGMLWGAHAVAWAEGYCACGGERGNTNTDQHRHDNNTDATTWPDTTITPTHQRDDACSQHIAQPK
jgi:hypothetical protein